jgi:hypothetical protein
MSDREQTAKRIHSSLLQASRSGTVTKADAIKLIESELETFAQAVTTEQEELPKSLRPELVVFANAIEIALRETDHEPQDPQVLLDRILRDTAELSQELERMSPTIMLTLTSRIAGASMHLAAWTGAVDEGVPSRADRLARLRTGGGVEFLSRLIYTANAELLGEKKSWDEIEEEDRAHANAVSATVLDAILDESAGEED